MKLIPLQNVDQTSETRSKLWHVIVMVPTGFNDISTYQSVSMQMGSHRNVTKIFNLSNNVCKTCFSHLSLMHTIFCSRLCAYCCVTFDRMGEFEIRDQRSSQMIRLGPLNILKTNKVTDISYFLWSNVYLSCWPIADDGDDNNHSTKRQGTCFEK